MKQDPHSGPTNIRRQRTIFSRPVDLSPGNYLYSCVIVTYTFRTSHLRCDLVSGPFPKIFPPKILRVYIVYPVPGQLMLTRHMCLKLPTANTALSIKRYMHVCHFWHVTPNICSIPKIEFVSCHVNIKKDVPSDYSNMVRAGDSSLLVFGNIRPCRLLNGYRCIWGA